MCASKSLLHIGIYLVIASSTILLNKWLYSRENIPILSLTLLHFISVFIGLQIGEKFNVFTVKSVHLDLILVPAVLFCALVTFMNFSLANNSLVIYQTSKTLITPVIISLQYFLYRKKCSIVVYTTMIFIMTGGILIFCNSSSFNINGTIFLITGICTTILYEFIFKNKQSELQINKLQLLYYYGPFSAILLGISIPIFESPFGIFSRNWTILQLVLICLSCLLTFLSNIITHWITGTATLLKCTVLLQVKLFCILLGSWLLFEEILNYFQLLGLGVNMFGSLAYSIIKTKDIKNYQEYKRII